MEIIKIENLTKYYGNYKALDNIDLSIQKGNIYGFIGPNGAGKSTTIRIILGLLKATKGSVQVFGMDAFNDSKEIHRRLAYVPAETNLWDNLTGGEVIDVLLNMSGKINEELRDDLIKKFDLDTSKKCGTYSKGNRQKVSLIAALATDVDLYVLDEPTSGLDPLMENVFQDIILEYKRKGKTIFLSSHILSEVEKVCDHIAIIKDGNIVDSGLLSEMRHFTSSKFMIITNDDIHLESIEGVHDIEIKNNEISFLVDNSKVNEVLKHLTKYNLQYIVANPPTLEDLFLSHYEKRVD